MEELKGDQIRLILERPSGRITIECYATSIYDYACMFRELLFVAGFAESNVNDVISEDVHSAI